MELTRDDLQFRRLIHDDLGWPSYGSDDPSMSDGHLVVALKNFLDAITPDNKYDFTKLIAATNTATAWMLIYRFINLNWIEYGVSPRHAWLQAEGCWLRQYVAAHTTQELLDIWSLEET